jgi:hypothetical protein
MHDDRYTVLLPLCQSYDNVFEAEAAAKRWRIQPRMDLLAAIKLDIYCRGGWYTILCLLVEALLCRE